MAVIETKYSVGDRVWHANLTTSVKQHPCPDCRDSREWEATSPAGGVFKVPCPRCTVDYLGNDDLNLKYSVWSPSVSALTIGLARGATGRGAAPEYMCLETGVGSGSVYQEDKLFPTEAEARACAEAMAAANNANPAGWVAKQFNKTARFCDYQLKDATMAAAVSRATGSLYRIGYLLEDLDQAESLEDVAQRIADWRENPPESPTLTQHDSQGEA